MPPTENTPEVEPGADPNVALQLRAIRTFFDQWDLYNRVIRHDYMFHEAIHSVLRSRLSSMTDFRVLDLGCGDAQLTSRTLAGLAVKQYVGVDVSPIAVKLASDNLELRGIPARVEANGVNYYLEDAPPETFDVVLAGYVAHHLIGPELTDFFSGVRRTLKPGGAFLLFDVFRGNGETREACLERNHAWRTQTWSELTREDLDSIWDHVSTADYPLNRDELGHYAREAGFALGPHLLYNAPTGIHRLYALR